MDKYTSFKIFMKTKLSTYEGVFVYARKQSLYKGYARICEGGRVERNVFFASFCEKRF